MVIPFREHHLLNLLDAYDQQSLPLDLFISVYFRNNKALGSKDRGYIAESLYAMVRWKGLIDYLCEKPITWEKRWNFFSKTTLNDHQDDVNIPQYVRCSFPEVLFNLLVATHGLEKTIELCRICNRAAPTTVRINTLKTTRDAMLERWKESYEVSPCLVSNEGIIFHKKISFFGLPEFKEGLFEIQDEGSQLLAKLVDAKPGQQIMDYCSGSGGKALAFAPEMKNSGQIFLHDIRPFALQESSKRLRRAGIQNAQIVQADNIEKLKKLKKKMQWVLVDAPCTGTGTMRRNPDMKWKFTEETLPRLLGQQRMIFEKALSFMHPEGRIVYATCSILNEENQVQADHFIKTYDLEMEGQPFQSLPSVGGMDGFYGIILKKKKSV